MLPSHAIKHFLLPTCDYELVAFRYFVVGKNRNHGGHQIYFCLFIVQGSQHYRKSELVAHNGPVRVN